VGSSGFGSACVAIELKAPGQPTRAGRVPEARPLKEALQVKLPVRDLSRRRIRERDCETHSAVTIMPGSWRDFTFCPSLRLRHSRPAVSVAYRPTPTGSRMRRQR